MGDNSAKIKGIFRYPVKGLTPQPVARIELSAGQTIPFDRMYAIENGPSGFDPAHPKYSPKFKFLELMRNARLAELRTAFDFANHTLTIRHENGVSELTPFLIDYAKYNDPELNAFFKEAIEIPPL